MSELLLIMLVSVLKGAGYLMPLIGLSIGAAVEECDSEQFEYIVVRDLGECPL